MLWPKAEIVVAGIDSKNQRKSNQTVGSDCSMTISMARLRSDLKQHSIYTQKQEAQGVCPELQFYYRCQLYLGASDLNML